MNKNKITNLQLIASSGLLSTSLLAGTCIKDLFSYTKQSTWLGVVIGKSMGLFFLILFMLLINKNRSSSLFQIIENKFGKIVGKIFSVLYLILISYFFMTALWHFSTFFTAEFLIETPAIAINIAFLFAFLAAIYYGVIATVRAGLLFFFTMIIVFLMTTIGAAHEFELNNLLPIFEPGFKAFFKTSVVIALNSIGPIFLLTIIPREKIEDDVNIGKSILIGYLIAFGVDVTNNLLLSGILGGDLITIYQCAIYSALKKVHFFGFIKRIENIFITLKLFPLIAWIWWLLYFISETIKYLFGILKNKIKLLILVPFSVSLAFFADKIFINQIVADTFLSNTLPIIFVIAFLVPSFALLIKKDRN